jgi:hypothetical protein
MAIADLIKELETATGPSRELDSALALLMGYKPKVEYISDPVSGGQRKLVLYVIPGGKDAVRAPKYTQFLDVALTLVQAISSDRVGGVSWDEGGGHAMIGDGAMCSGATPAIALCLAALKIREREERGS